MQYDGFAYGVQKSSSIGRASSTLVSLMGFIDTVIVGGSLWFVARGQPMFDGRSLSAELLHVALIVLLMSTVFKLSRSWRGVRLRTEFIEVTAYASATFFLISATYWLIGLTPIDEASNWLYLFVRTYALAFCGIVGVRLFARVLLRYYRSRGGDLRYAAIIGATPDAEQLVRIFEEKPWMGIRLRGVFDDSIDGPRVSQADPASVAIDGNIADLHQITRFGLVHRIYITLPTTEKRRIDEIIDRFHNTTASIFYCPPALQMDTVNGRWESLYGRPVLSVVNSPFEGTMGRLKRLEDIVLLSFIMPIALPLMLIIAIAVRMTSEGPALFRQKRYGLDGKPFTIHKFRTMYVSESNKEFRQATKNDPRVTPLGRFLRKTSLDELPQLFNVMDSSMSVIGPRPHPVRLDDQYREQVRRYMLRNKIKPGMTGLAQVRGWRGETETIELMERRVITDIEYMSNWSFWLDFKILLQTLFIPIKSERAY